MWSSTRELRRGVNRSPQMKDICFVSLGVQYCMIWPRHGICSIMHRDNLTKRNWKGDSKCCFCVIRKKTYNICSLIARWQSLPGMLFSFLLESFHLLVYHICWVLGWMVFPWSLENKYNVVYFKKRKQMLVGAAAICWALWSSRNDAVFSQKFPNSYLQVIFRETHWTRYSPRSAGWSWNAVRGKYCWAGWSWSWWLE